MKTKATKATKDTIEYLKQNMKVSVSVVHNSDYYSNGFRVSVKLSLDGEEIASDSDSFDLPGER